MLGILQLSDIHFAYERGDSFDVDSELQNGVIRILPEIFERVGEINLITVCGDVAYNAAETQYAAASAFLRDVRSVIGSIEIPVKVIPGNHDVLWATADQVDQSNWRSRPRMTGLSDDDRSQTLRDLLRDRASGPGLLQPLAAYNEFASAYRCEISPSNSCWEDEFAITDTWTLRLRGLTSVLVSDRNDKSYKLVLGDFQLSDLDRREPGFVHMTLCHHPYKWLLDANAQEPRITNRSELHVTGHEHRHKLNEEKLPRHLHLEAGALQPPRKDEAREPRREPRFNAIRLDVVGPPEQPKLEIQIVAAKWVPASDGFVIDESTCSVKQVDLTPSEEIAQVSRAASVDKARLTERFATLQDSDIVDTAQAIGVQYRQLLDRPRVEWVRFVVERAEQSDLLPELWDEIAKRNGGTNRGVNPYEGD